MAKRPPWTVREVLLCYPDGTKVNINDLTPEERAEASQRINDAGMAAAGDRRIKQSTEIR